MDIWTSKMKIKHSTLPLFSGISLGRFFLMRTSFNQGGVWGSQSLVFSRTTLMGVWELRRIFIPLIHGGTPAPLLGVVGDPLTLSVGPDACLVFGSGTGGLDFLWNDVQCLCILCFGSRHTAQQISKNHSVWRAQVDKILRITNLVLKYLNEVLSLTGPIGHVPNLQVTYIKKLTKGREVSASPGRRIGVILPSKLLWTGAGLNTGSSSSSSSSSSSVRWLAMRRGVRFGSTVHTHQNTSLWEPGAF